LLLSFFRGVTFIFIIALFFFKVFFLFLGKTHSAKKRFILKINLFFLYLKMYTVMNTLCRPFIFTLIILAISYQRSLALECYDNTSGEMQLLSNDEWTFCAFIPANGNKKGSVFGLSPESDDLSPYMLAFGGNEPGYQILTMCTYEQYDFAQLVNKPLPKERLFRCVCNYDKCNDLTTFENYLGNLGGK
jgi:hypothetical protein